jgi:hypothetical protein
MRRAVWSLQADNPASNNKQGNETTIVQPGVKGEIKAVVASLKPEIKGAKQYD